jgi:3-hydroxyisobutyrate dehydrogenase-like beta-hydroxyacid dehydrogenase
VTSPDGVLNCRDERHAAEGADLVLSVNSAADAPGALAAGLPGLAEHAVWADLNTASAGTKRRLAETAAAAGARFADVALMATVPGRGLRTPMLISGPGARQVADIVTALGGSAEVLDGPAGLAATRKLLRSVFFKGLAAAVVEALRAAETAGCRDWLHGNIAEELERAGAGTVDRLVEGSHRHAVRRAHEMDAASMLLEELGVPSRVSRASQAWLEELQGGREGAAAPAEGRTAPSP